MKKRLIKAMSVILTVMMLVGVVPVGAMTAFAADVKEAAPEVRATVTDAADKAGEAVKNGAETVKDGAKSLYNSAVTAVSNGIDAVQTAIETKTSGDYEYIVLGDGTAEITKYTGSDAELVIPGELDGYVVTSIGDSAFKDCKSITSVTISNSVTKIYSHAFNSCINLADVKLGAGVAEIGYGVFAGTAITEIVIPKSVVTTTDISAFYDATKLKKVVFENGMTKVPYSVLSGCESVEEVVIPNSVTTIGGSAFSRCTGLTGVEIPNSVTTIGDSAFYGCTGLTSVEIPNSVTTINDATFYGCTGLTSVMIPDSVTSIGIAAFYGCTGLVNVVIPNSVEDIEWEVFEECSNLKSITLSNKITRIPHRGFFMCESLESVTIPESVTSIEPFAFLGCNSLTELTIPKNVNYLDEYWIQASNLQKIEVDPDNEYYCSVDGVLFNKDKTELMLYPAGRFDTVYTIPKGVKTVGSGSFAGSMNLTEVVMNEGITSINDNAFSTCVGLTELTFPNGLEMIGDGVFTDCIGITRVNLPNSIKKIGNSFTKMGDTPNLKSVYYDGSEEEWHSIDIEKNNDALFEAFIHFKDLPFTLSDQAIVLNVGETYKMEAFSGDRNVSQNAEWTSHDDEIFSVSDDGKITALSEGSGVVWVDLGAKKSAICVVYVGKPNGFKCDVTYDKNVYYSDKTFNGSFYSMANYIALDCSYGNKIDKSIKGKVDTKKFSKYFSDVAPFKLTATINGDDLSFSNGKYQNTFTAEYSAKKPGEVVEKELHLYPYNFSLSSGGNTYVLTLKFESESFNTIVKSYSFTVKDSKEMTPELFVSLHKGFADKTKMPEKFGFYENAWKDENGKSLWAFYTWDVIGDVGEVITFKFNDLTVSADYYDLFFSDIILKYNEVTLNDNMRVKVADGYKNTYNGIRNVLMSSSEWEKNITAGSSIDLEVKGFLSNPNFELTDAAYTALSKVLKNVFVDDIDKFVGGVESALKGMHIASQFCRYIGDATDIVNAFQEAYRAYIVAKLYKETNQEFFDVLYSASLCMDNRKYANWFMDSWKKFQRMSTDDRAIYECSLSMMKDMGYKTYDLVFKNVVRGLSYQAISNVINLGVGEIALLAAVYNTTYGILDKVLNIGNRSKPYYIMNYIAPLEKALCEVEGTYAKQVIENPNLETAFAYDEAYSVLRCVNMYLYQTAHDFFAAEKNTDYMETATLFLDTWNNVRCHIGSPASGKKKYVSVQCPVDVNVYDTDGNLLVSVIDEEIKVCDESVTLIVSDRKKSMVYPADKDYRIEVIPRSTGFMNYYVAELNDGAVTKEIGFYDVPLSKREKYTANIPQELGVDSSEYALTMGDKTVDCNYDSTVSICADDEHKFENWIEEESTNICKDGVKSRTCSVCGKKEYEIIEASHLHTEVKGAYEPTCTEDGYEGNTVCSDCGEFISEGKKIPKDGHTNTGWITVKEPTATDTGLKECRCATCGSVLKEEILPDNGKIIDSGYCGADTKWKLTENFTLVVSGAGVIKHYSSASAVPWNKYADKIKCVVIENGVTRIGEFAFSNLANLESVFIADSVKEISGYAFKKSKSIIKLTLSDNLEKVGDSAFYGCSSLRNIIIPKSVSTVGYYSFTNCYALMNVEFCGDAPIFNSNAFKNVSASVYYPGNNKTWTSEKMQDYNGKITWVERTDEIRVADCGYCGQDTVWKLSNDGTLTISGTGIVKNYDNASLVPWNKYADQIKKVVVEEGVTRIGEFAFYGCTNLTSVTLPNSLKEINGYVFKKCSSLTEINLPSGLTKIGDSAFYGTGLKKLAIPANVKYVGWYAFSRCASLTEIEFLGSAPELPGKAFNMVTATVYYPSGNSSWNNVAWDKLGGTITHKAK